MNHRKLIASLIAVGCVFALVMAVLIISHTVVSERLLRTEYSVPEEAMLAMTEGISLDPLESVDYAEGIERKYAALDEKGTPVAYVFEAVSGGLDGDVRIRIAFDEDYIITGIQVLETAAQPTNLGFRAASESYLNQYIGASSVTTEATSVTGTLIESAEGADYSCQGVYSCVSAAFRQVELLKAASAAAEAGAESAAETESMPESETSGDTGLSGENGEPETEGETENEN